MLAIEWQGPDRIVLSGRLDASQAPAAQAFLDRAQGKLTLDCAALEYISSPGLGVLLKTQKRLSATGGGLRLAGLSRHLRDILSYSGFDQIFEIEPAA